MAAMSRPQPEQWQLSGDAAELYERYPAQYLLRPWVADLVARAGLRRGERVLDLACGTGLVARLAAPAIGPTGRVTGLDLNPGMLAVARRLPAPSGAPITWVEGSALAMDVADDSIDVILCQQGFQFFPDRRAALGEMRRVLVPGGRLLLSVWRIAGPYHRALTEALARHVGAEAASGFAASRIAPDAEELHRLVLEAGFRDVAVHASAMSIRLPEVEDFVLWHLAATPVARAVAAVSPHARAGLAQQVSAALAVYASGDGVTVPDETNLVTALAPG
jgi:ubiquinone/menaquinone biosynthesis C-methylase UbiE